MNSKNSLCCHVMFAHEYSYRFYQLIEKYFELDQHKFLVTGASTWNQQFKGEYKNSIWTEDLRQPEARKCLEEATGIIVHGLFYEATLDYFCENPGLLAKTSWIIWGGDLYDEIRKAGFAATADVGATDWMNRARRHFENLRLSWKFSAPPWVYSSREIKRRYFIQRLNKVIGASREDFRILKRFYETNARYTYGFYPILMDWDYYNSLSLASKTHNSPVRILIGNSATPTNRHIEAFQILAHFNKDNVQIICPLVYGSPSYRQAVIESGVNIFGENFFPITEFTPFRKYMDLLLQVDAAIMNHNRQQAVGTIFLLMILRKKVYIPTGLSTYRFLKEKGLRTHPVADLKQFTDIQQLQAQDEYDTDNNQSIIIRDFSDIACKNAWEKIFCAPVANR